MHYFVLLDVQKGFYCNELILTVQLIEFVFWDFFY